MCRREDGQTGKTVWETIRPVANSWNSPIVAKTESNFQLITAADPWVTSYDPATGKELWKHASGDYVVAAPVVHAGVVYVVTGGDPELDAAERKGALIAIDASSGEFLWEIADLDPIFTTPAIVGDAIVLAMQTQEQPLTVLTVDTTDHNRTSPLFPELPAAQ